MDDATNETPGAAPATPAYVTLGEASRRTGMTKSALSRRIKSGQLSVRERGEDGAFRIDVSELLRFMSTTPVQRAGDTVDTPSSAPIAPLLDPPLATRLAVVEAQLVELRAMLIGLFWCAGLVMPNSRMASAIALDSSAAMTLCRDSPALARTR